MMVICRKMSGITLALLMAGCATGPQRLASDNFVASPYRVNARSSEIEVRADLFADESEVADGVGIALAPLFKK
jgi:hypothetical protein